MAALCAFCLHANPSDAKFCNECGNTLRLRPCARCDAVNDVDARQCHSCNCVLAGNERHADASPAASGTDTETEAFPDSLQRRADAVIERASSSSAPAMASRHMQAASGSASAPFTFAPKAASGPPAPTAKTPDEEKPETTRQSSSVIRALEQGALSRPSLPVRAALVAAQPVRSSRRAVIAVSILAAVLIVAAEGYRRTSGLDAWTDIPAISSLWSLVHTRASSSAMTEVRPAAQPITTVAPNAVMQDALATDPALTANTHVERPAGVVAQGEASGAPLPPGNAAKNGDVRASTAPPPAPANGARATNASSAAAPIATSAAPNPAAASAAANRASASGALMPAIIPPPQPSRSPAAPTVTQTASKASATRRAEGRNAARAAPDRASPAADVETPKFELPVGDAAPVASCTPSVAALGLCGTARGAR